MSGFCCSNDSWTTSPNKHHALQKKTKRVIDRRVQSLNKHKKREQKPHVVQRIKLNFITLHRVFHGIRLLRLNRELFVVRQSIPFLFDMIQVPQVRNTDTLLYLALIVSKTTSGCLYRNKSKNIGSISDSVFTPF